MHPSIEAKETQIGRVPVDWEVKRIREVDYSKDAVQTGPFGSMLHARDYAENGVPLLLVKNIVDGQVVDEMPKVNPKKAEELKRFWLKEGDIVFTRVGAVGRTLYIDKKYEGWMFSGQTLRIRINNKKVNNRFVEYFFRSPLFQKTSEATALGTTRPSINTSILANTYVPIPPKIEQDHIVNILSSIDSKIELNRKMNQTLEDINRAIFRHWFVDFEFPNEEGKPCRSNEDEMIDSELGEIPKGWLIKSMDQVAEFLNGLALQRYPPTEGSYLPVIKIRELRQGITESSDRCGKDIDEAYVVDDGDVLFSWSGSLEIKIWYGGRGALNQHLFKVTSKQYPKWFYYYWILYHLPEFRRIAAGKATTMGHIQRHHLSEAKVLVPPESTFKIMDKVMKPLLDCYLKNGVESRILTEIRGILLPKLMSGELRIQVRAEKGVNQ